MDVDPGPAPFAAVILAGGRAARLGGVDKASVEIGGRTLLARAIDAVVDASEVVAVGEPVPTERPVTFTYESPRYGGPVAALLTGRDALLHRTPYLVVLAVDMPRVDAHTVRRLLEAAPTAEGAALVGPDGRRQLALALATERLDAVRPGQEEQHDLALHRLLSRLHLAAVPAVGEEHRDIDTWADLRDFA
ncbi:molybdenum cofactor guanylyltransferase [Nocardioides sp. cx-173]|uniref:molybdenum cofactor guanylyltransferase n=1 Tax=Nocardioides sp. cx-173 TaxID=2898796 RepID=UPI001E37F9EB|nr:NTP transferase domain-containing protein [Nocardioides sp. cx-173]MCD4523596.1 NTP transferase domain-containing protein [Nocardioides sp. cx-173]UGB42068.1 NTP transferase domain-containing protein [Nocardioides sp. cx-173]